MASEGTPAIRPTKHDVEFLAWQKYLREKICDIFEITEEELNSAYGVYNYNKANVERTLHGARPSDSETE